MNITAREAARLIDSSAVRTHHSLNDIDKLVEYGKNTDSSTFMYFRAG